VIGETKMPQHPSGTQRAVVEECFLRPGGVGPTSTCSNKQAKGRQDRSARPKGKYVAGATKTKTTRPARSATKWASNQRGQQASGAASDKRS